MKLAEFSWSADLTPATENVFTRSSAILPFPGFNIENGDEKPTFGMYSEVAESEGLGQLEFLLGTQGESEEIVGPGDPTWDRRPNGSEAALDDDEEPEKRLPIFPDPTRSIEAHDALVNRVSALLSQSAIAKPAWAGGSDAAFRGPWLLVLSDEQYVFGRRIKTHRCVLLLMFQHSGSELWFVEAHGLEDGILVSTAEDADRIRSCELDYPCNSQDICDLLEEFEGELPTEHWENWGELWRR